LKLVFQKSYRNFKNGKLEIREGKTDKLQYREINQNVSSYVKDYAIENKLSPTDKIFRTSGQ